MALYAKVCTGQDMATRLSIRRRVSVFRRMAIDGLAQGERRVSVGRSTG